MAQDYAKTQALPLELAQDIVASSTVFSKSDTGTIAGAISEVTYESQIAGPDLLTLTISDPAWEIQRSGLLDMVNGDVPLIDINFPRNSDVWFRLNMPEGLGGDLTSQNLQLTFQHRLVSYLQWDWGTLTAAPGTTKYTQFAKQLCDRIPNALNKFNPSVLGPGTAASQTITLICPDQNAVATPKTTPSPKTAADNTGAKLNKTGGIPYGTNLTLDGTKLNNKQVDVANTALRAAQTAGSNTVATTAMIYAAMGENQFGYYQYPANYYNVWAANNPGEYGPDPNWAAMATAFLEGTNDFQSNGGALALSKRSSDPVAIANAVENNAVYESSGGNSDTFVPGTADSYGPRLGGTAQLLAEAKAIVTAFGGGSASTAGGSSTSTGQIERGGQGNSDQDSWSCLQSLASTINYLCFSSIGIPGQWGNYLYFIPGPTLDAAMPSGSLVFSPDNPGTWDLKAATKKATLITRNALQQQPSYTIDNSAFLYKTTRTRRGRVQRAITSNVKPQSPTQIQVQLICDPLEYNAGEVMQIQDSGPINGNWIVEDNTRNMIGDVYSTLTLQPPTAPTPQPAASSSSPNASTTPAASGTVGKVIQMAKFLSSKQLTYNQGNVVQKYPAFESGGYDCAGGVAYILYNGGIPLPAGGGVGKYGPASGNWETWGDAGPGQQMTIWANSIHIFVEFHYQGGHQGWDSGHPWSASAPWYSDTFYDGNYVTSGEGGIPFTSRHWPGT